MIAQADGRAAVCTLVPGGHAEPRRGRRPRSPAPGPRGVLRVTPWRSIVLTDLDPAQAARAIAGLAGAGLLIHPHTPWAGVTTCTGRPGCAQALADVRADAARFPEAVRPAGRGCADEHADDAPLPLHWAGCERRCGHPAGRYVEVLATPGGYEVLRDGTAVGPADDGRVGAPAVRGGPTTSEATAYELRLRRDGAEIYRRSFATIRAEADLARPAGRRRPGRRPDDPRVRDGRPRRRPRVQPRGRGAARNALDDGAPVLCDAAMVAAGVTRKRLPAANEVLVPARRPAGPRARRGARHHALGRGARAVGRPAGRGGRRDRQRPDGAVPAARD